MVLPEIAAMKLRRDVSVEECPWLDQPLAAGEIVYLYTGYTYGVISPAGTPCTRVPRETPFFEVPSNALTDAA